MKSDAFNWKEDKLKTVLYILWLLTVVSCFFDGSILVFVIPGLFTLYPFRVLLPVTTLLYLIWVIREKRNLWNDACFTHRVCYVLCGILAVYSTFSLFKAIDFDFTFGLWITLGFDLIFFLLALELCKDQCLFVCTIQCVLVSFLIQICLGIKEVFWGGIFSPRYDGNGNVTFFGLNCQWPLVSEGNTNDYCMMLIFMLALLLMYWAWRGYQNKFSWFPVVVIAPVYFLTHVAEARLCELCFWFLLVGFILFLLTLRRKGWMLATVILTVLFVMFGVNFQKLIPVHEEHNASIIAPKIVVVEIDLLDDEIAVPLADDGSLKAEFFVKDEESGEFKINTTKSAGIRLSLLLHAWDCFVKSKGMGVGLGNTAQLAKLDMENRSNIYAIHCFIVRMIADFGICFLIPFLLLATALLLSGMKFVISGFKCHDWKKTTTGVLYLTAIIVYPIASTASGDAQNSLPMWLFLAGVVLFPMYLQKTESK